jgi:putative tryptophan/tyrosine transport system substrate-binding protein
VRKEVNGERCPLMAQSGHHDRADRLPVVYQFREYVLDGGLLSYGPNLPDAYRQVVVYAARILKGAKASDPPVWQATKFDLVLNLKTAKALGLRISPSLLLRADEVIE